MASTIGKQELLEIIAKGTKVSFGNLFVSNLLQLSASDMRNLKLVASELLDNLQDFILSCRNTSDVEILVRCLFWLLQDSNYSFTDEGE